ncbi:MAG: hypothetical protein KDA51_08230 [Planctomycetales bacterium]|nr:hypothetical protein [Planctomycetales bacterium]MCA9181427.1 hypothetical protein [Planctomycetales bacterium]
MSRLALAEVVSYHETMATVDKLTGEVRRAMTDKYQTQFQNCPKWTRRRVPGISCLED